MPEALHPSLEPVAAFAAIARELTESLELPEVLRRIAARMLALTGAQGVSVVVPRAELAEFMIHESPPPHSLIPVGFRFRPSGELIDSLRARRDPLVLRDLHASPLVPSKIKARIAARDLVIVPLRVGDELLGALIIAYNELPSEWPVSRSMLRVIGDQAAIAMRNAQLYEVARETNQQLVQAEKLSAIGQLVASVAHEVNNPLATARLLVESLEAESLGAGPLEQLQSLDQELGRAATVVRDLLLFAHKRHAQTVPVDLNAFLTDLADGLGSRFAAAGTDLVLELADVLPLTAADPNGLRQIVTNLIDNALAVLVEQKAERRIVIRTQLAAGAGTVHTGLGAEGPAPSLNGPSSSSDGSGPDAGDPVIVLEIEDNGPGLPPDLMAQLFEPFVTTKPIGEGTGLGLPIVREIVEAHHGEVHAMTGSGGGALFRIGLPLAEPTVEVKPDPTPAEAPWGMQVLVIDDEVALQRALRRVLHLLGCEVTSALNGNEGFALARDNEYDLILCDIRIPGLNGRELHERLCEEAPDKLDTLAYMTGDTVSGEVLSFIESTGAPALAKPFGRAQLEELLKRFGDEQHR